MTEVDPEVLADLQLRASSVHDSTRGRPSEAVLGTWTPSSKSVGVWKCRTPPCAQLVPVTEEALERWEKCNSWLASRGEAPLEASTILRCDRCRDEIRSRRPALFRQRVDEMAEAIRKLRTSPQPRQEHELIRQITTWHHPDVPGLLEALDPQSKTGRNRKRGEL